jgi:hypothetical protein
MKKYHLVVALALAFVVTAGLAVAAEALTSGPQVGSAVPGPFHPLNVTGEKAGEKFCLFCCNGTNPVAMIFARENSPQLDKLIKKIDEQTIKNADAKMGSFVVFLSDKEGLENELKNVAKENDLKKTVLAIDNPAGPKAYKVSQEADVTVVLYTDHMVKANHAFRKGELKDKDIDTIVSELPKILEK